MAKGLPRDIAERIIVFANELNDALKEDLGRSIDYTYKFDNMPAGFLINQDEDREICGWYWRDHQIGWGANDSIVALELKRQIARWDKYWKDEHDAYFSGSLS